MAQYEWRKHGVCSGLKPDGYFALMRRAFASIVIPARFAGPAGATTTSPPAIEDAFVAANPGLSTAAMSVRCSQGQLDEVRICFDGDLRFRRCPQVDRDTCRARQIVVPAVQ